MTPITNVGTITNAKDPFLYAVSPKLPNAGAVEYCPKYLNPIDGGTMNKNVLIAARTASAFGKSCGFSISEIKVGNRICGTHKNVIFNTAFIHATQSVPFCGNAYVLTSPSEG